jgi:hypothetical protein
MQTFYVALFVGLASLAAQLESLQVTWLRAGASAPEPRKCCADVGNPEYRRFRNNYVLVYGLMMGARPPGPAAVRNACSSAVYCGQRHGPATRTRPSQRPGHRAPPPDQPASHAPALPAAPATPPWALTRDRRRRLPCAPRSGRLAAGPLRLLAVRGVRVSRGGGGCAARLPACLPASLPACLPMGPSSTAANCGVAAVPPQPAWPGGDGALPAPHHPWCPRAGRARRPTLPAPLAPLPRL